MFVKAGLWGLKIEAGKEYSQLIDSSFTVTSAALSFDLPKNGTRTVVSLTTNEKEFVLCSLTPGKIEQQVVDLSFLEGDEITFKSTGNCDIDLLGNYLVDTAEFPNEYDSDDSEENMWMDGDSDDMEGDSDDDEDLEDVDSDELEQIINGKRKLPTIPDSTSAKKAKIVELKEEAVKPTKAAAKKEEKAAEKATPAKKEAAKKETPAASKKDAAAAAAKETTPAKKDTTPSKKEAAAAKKEATTPAVSAKAVAKAAAQTTPKEDPKAAAKPAPATTAKTSAPKTKKLPSGLIMEDVLEGQGAKAKAGKRVGVRYIGRLTNGKVFDSNTKGAPFRFRLGAGEVIKGWDQGVQGMGVGGTRKLTIPAALAYGSRGAPPDIPGNATLEFEIKLLEIK
ncbi:uncharacterized protein EV422DRAFT_523936 [Fimicolochytrium jonesii]|uniref:uncharacterized protein n=1 Tax=Fimicolochytrium jonesii TaxID=1396493 RepID=UPI0022FDD041|nr:uncharacterized protein EV422DRAFT_523936 [Fimicolochytrium jonesii]KAI8822416.1 hypothetical protein EV422DRAFT_523936 [Fimicolochytrium jonesii]